MTHEVGGAFQWHREDRSGCLGRGNYRCSWTSGWIGIKDGCCACLLQCSQPRRQLLGEVHLDTSNVCFLGLSGRSRCRSRGSRGTASPRCGGTRLRTLMRWHKLHMQARTVRFARLPTRRRRQFRLERQPRAARDLEAARDRSTSPFAARHRPRHRHRVAVGRVEREARPVDHRVDRADISRDTVDDLRQRIRRDRDLR